ncbi:MAG: TrmH family RNA methyltransferase [Candidatus Dojkabacteria bacterium]|nr:TrmH family RNA methyltransferase [Candidatus Dojkabacteria bacterium]
MKYHFSKIQKIQNQDIIVILDNIRSALNVGSIIRTCDGAGVKTIISVGITPTREHIKVRKTAIGAENFVKNIYINNENIIAYITNLKKTHKVISIEKTDNSLPYDLNYIEKYQNIAFVFGNEISGINPKIIEISDYVFELPMLGVKNSLNVAVTAGIVLYHKLLLQMNTNKT